MSNPQGYANPSQIAGGIHIRLFARTFIVADAAGPASRVAFVNMDAGEFDSTWFSHSLRLALLRASSVHRA